MCYPRPMSFSDCQEGGREEQMNGIAISRPARRIVCRDGGWLIVSVIMLLLHPRRGQLGPVIATNSP